MADQTSRRIIASALAAKRSHPDAPPIDVLDLAMEDLHGTDLDMEAEGQPFADWLDPPSDFARILYGLVVLFVQIGALSPEPQHPCGFPADASAPEGRRH